MADSVSVREATGALYSMEDVLEETKAEAKLVRELEEYGVVKGELRGGGVRYFDETEREIIAAVAELARYGVGGRNLRVFRSSADREANLLQQILAPALRSRNPQRRKEALGGAGEPRGGRHPPQAPAAGPRPAQDRPLMSRRGLAPSEDQAAMPTARRSRTIAAPAEELWEVIGDPHHLPRWWPRVNTGGGRRGRRVHRGDEDRQGQTRARRLPVVTRRLRDALAGMGAASSREHRSPA